MICIYLRVAVNIESVIQSLYFFGQLSSESAISNAMTPIYLLLQSITPNLGPSGENKSNIYKTLGDKQLKQMSALSRALIIESVLFVNYICYFELCAPGNRVILNWRRYHLKLPIDFCLIKVITSMYLLGVDKWSFLVK